MQSARCRSPLLAALLTIPPLLLMAPRAGATTPFVLEFVATSGNTGTQSSLALNASGIPCIAFFHETTQDLRYATKVGGYWQIEDVDVTNDVGRYPAIALDSAGNPHISYWDGTNGRLKYAHKSGSSWTIETVDAGPNVGKPSSIRLTYGG